MQNSIATHNFAAILPGDSVAGLVVANGITNFLNIYNSLLIVRLVLTWFPNSPPAIVAPLRYPCCSTTAVFICLQVLRMDGKLTLDLIKCMIISVLKANLL